MKGLFVLVGVVPVLMGAACGDQNACDHPPPEVGAIVTDAQASTDPCAGRPDLHILAWYSRGELGTHCGAAIAILPVGDTRTSGTTRMATATR